MKHTFLMEMRAYHPARTDNYSPTPRVDKYAISVDFAPGFRRPEPNAELYGRVSRENAGFITFCLSVDIPDDMGISLGELNSLRRKGHYTEDGSADYCEIVAPTLVWDYVYHEHTDEIFAEAVAHIDALKSVKLSYPDGNERKLISLPVTNWWVTHANFPVNVTYEFAARNPGAPILEVHLHESNR